MAFLIRNGEQLRAQRERKRISLRKLARAAGISAAYLSDIELGRRPLNEGMTVRLGAAYDELAKDNR